MTRLRISAVTDRGAVREANEDAIGVAGWLLAGDSVMPLVWETTGAVDVLLADGMGGHAGGQIASRLAVETFLTATGTVEQRVAAADDAVRRSGSKNVALRGMGTTLAGACIDANGRVQVFGVGDTRIYRILDGYLGLLTEDDRGPASRALTSFIGGGTTARAHIFDAELLPGDRLFCCTDGVHDVLDDATIGHLLAQGSLESIRSAVLTVGAVDNFSAIIIDVLSED